MLLPSIRVAEAHGQGHDVAYLDAVLVLRFEYDPDLVELVKHALRKARRWEKVMCEWLRAGGWSPRRRYWWVDPEAWPAVRRQLLEKGVRLSGPDELMEPKPKPKLRGFFKD
jgi:hypothetical protein